MILRPLRTHILERCPWLEARSPHILTPKLPTHGPTTHGPHPYIHYLFYHDSDGCIHLETVPYLQDPIVKIYAIDHGDFLRAILRELKSHHQWQSHHKAAR